MVNIESVNKGQKLFLLGALIMTNSFFSCLVKAQDYMNKENIDKVFIAKNTKTTTLITESDKLEIIAVFNKDALFDVLVKKNKRRNWTGSSDTGRDYYEALDREYKIAVQNSNGLLAFDFATPNFRDISAEEEKKEFISIYAPEYLSNVEYLYGRYKKNPGSTEIKNNYYSALEIAYYTALGNMIRQEMKAAAEEEIKKMKLKNNKKQINMAKSR